MNPSVRVAVTRPRRPDDTLAAALREAGHEPVVVPLLRIEPADDGPLRGALVRLRPGDWLAVTSPNGARAVVDAGGVPTGVRRAAVGERTADALGGADVVPATSTAVALGAALSCERPGRLLLPVAGAASAVIEERLGAAGWDVERLDVYRTAAVDPAEVDAEALRACPVVTLLSGSAAGALAALGPAPGQRLVCIGPSTTAAAGAAGLTVDAEAPTHDVAGVVAAVGRLLGTTP